MKKPVSFLQMIVLNAYWVGLVIAMVVQPLSGTLSDGWVSRFGRRRPLIVLGTLFDFAFLAFIGWAGGLIWLFIGYVGLQFSSNVAHGPALDALNNAYPGMWIGYMALFLLGTICALVSIGCLKR